MKPNQPEASFPIVSFPEGFDVLAEEEAVTRGLLDNVTVELGDGRRFSLMFSVPIRVLQEAESSLKHDPVCYAAPNIVMVPVVTVAQILKAVRHLDKRKYFDALVSET